MSKRKCIQCGTILSQSNLGDLCRPCQKKRLDEQLNAEEPNYDAEALAYLLGLTSGESVKRKARNGELPPRIPGVRKWLWPKDVIDSWIRSGHQNVLTAEARDAILVALMKGYPIEEATLYGYDINNLISQLKTLGYMPDKKPGR